MKFPDKLIFAGFSASLKISISEDVLKLALEFSENSELSVKSIKSSIILEQLLDGEIVSIA